MKSATAVVRAGVCGFTTRVRAESEDDFSVRLAVESDCEKVRAFGAELAEAGAIDGLAEIAQGHEGTILSIAARHCRGCCAACVAPDGAFKAMQVAAGLALPVSVQIELAGGE